MKPLRSRQRPKQKPVRLGGHAKPARKRLRTASILDPTTPFIPDGILRFPPAKDVFDW